MTYHITVNTDGSKMTPAIDSKKRVRGFIFLTHYCNKTLLGDDKRMKAMRCFQGQEASKAACVEPGIVILKDREVCHAFAKAYSISYPLQALAIKKNPQPAYAARKNVERRGTDQVDRFLGDYQIRFKTPTARAIALAAIIQ